MCFRPSLSALSHPVNNTMLPQTGVLLILCVSTGMCATLGHYQTQETQEEEEEAPAVDLAAVIDGAVAAASVDAAIDGAAPAAAQVGDSPLDEEPAANPLYGDKLLAKVLGVDTPAADKPESAVSEGDVTGGAVTQEPFSEEEVGNEIRPVKTDQSLNRPLAHDGYDSWSLNSIRNSFQTVHGYFGSLVELVGGHNGVCQYRCRYGEPPQPRPGYQRPEPNGCSSSLVGFQLDLGIPAMTTCCNLLDVCYDTCGSSKHDCDSRFRYCLHGLCSDLNKSLGFVSKVEACESVADTLYNTVWTLGCRPYMNSQRAACVCEGERDEL